MREAFGFISREKEEMSIQDDENPILSSDNIPLSPVHSLHTSHTSHQQNKKKSYPFGTPDHGKIPFSNIAHLTPNNLQFAIQLASSNGPHEDQKLNSNQISEKKTINHKKLPVISVSNDTELLNSIEGLSESDKGLVPCTRQDCKEVIISIIEIQAKNQIERDEIVQECEKMIQLHQQLEEECAVIEADNKRMILEGNILELRMKTLSSKLAKCDATKAALDHERDELNSKVLMTPPLSLISLPLSRVLCLCLCS